MLLGPRFFLSLAATPPTTNRRNARIATTIGFVACAPPLDGVGLGTDGSMGGFSKAGFGGFETSAAAGEGKDNAKANARLAARIRPRGVQRMNESVSG
jgi:hypothetical protein